MRAIALAVALVSCASSEVRPVASPPPPSAPRPVTDVEREPPLVFDPWADDEDGSAVGMMESYATAMCACASRACAAAVQDDMQTFNRVIKWRTEQIEARRAEAGAQSSTTTPRVEPADEEIVMPPDVRSEMSRITEKYAGCLTTLENTGGSR